MIIFYIMGFEDICVMFFFDCICLFISINAISIFFSVHYLVLYYLLQPYNTAMQMRSASYSLASMITYFVCYYGTKCAKQATA